MIFKIFNTHSISYVLQTKEKKLTLMLNVGPFEKKVSTQAGVVLFFQPYLSVGYIQSRGFVCVQGSVQILLSEQSVK